MGRKKGKSKKKGGLFRPVRHKWIAKIVTFKDPDSAEKAAEKLVKEVKKSKRKSRALTIARALTYAANRAEASAKRRNLSPKERKELKEIAEIYREAADEAWEIYHEKYD